MTREFCPTCARYGRQLWVGCCLCTGDVGPFKAPGELPPMPNRDTTEAVPAWKENKKPKKFTAPPIAFKPKRSRRK